MSISRLLRSTPESQGVTSSAIASFIEAVEASDGRLHSLMLLRHGRVIAEGWWRPYAPSTPHMAYSLTKSFTSMAAGFAISEGRLSLDDPVLSFFPRQAPRSPSRSLQALCLRHLLTMTTGHDEDPTSLLIARLNEHPARVFFEAPLMHAPGTHFVYNSAASHMVSMIVQKLTGQKLVNYLKPRLFEPLGIGRPRWVVSPGGHSIGGWGLFVRTEDIAAFGQTLLQEGVWQGEQVIPREWVRQATAKQVSNGNDSNSDWAQGYGFQFWRSRYGYRGDGAFGQFCVVLPEHDAVLATTAATLSMQGILDLAWKRLLPGFHAATLADNRPAELSLRQRLAELDIDFPRGKVDSPLIPDIRGVTFHLEENPAGLTSFRLEFTRTGARLMLCNSNGEHTVRCGLNSWRHGKTGLDSAEAIPTASRGAWTGDRTWEATVCYDWTTMVRTIRLDFDKDQARFRSKLTGTFEPPSAVDAAAHRR